MSPLGPGASFPFSSKYARCSIAPYAPSASTFSTPLQVLILRIELETDPAMISAAGQQTKKSQSASTTSATTLYHYPGFPMDIDLF